MVAICGWMRTRETEGASQDAQAVMAARLTGAGFVGRRTDTTGLYASGGETTAESAGVSVAIRGRLSWSDADLQGQARTQGDARALICAYQRHGVDCLRLLRGDYAIAVADTRQRSTLLAIDRMGIQPLYYTITTDDELVFASTADIIRYRSNIAAEIDRQAVYNYLYFHMVPSPGTIYRDIFKLEPAQYALYQDGRLQLGYHWQPQFLEHINDADPQALGQELERTLRACVRRCSSHEHTGAFLSGGLDSSTVCGLLAETREHKVDAYTIGFDAQGYDEMAYARIAGRHFGLELHERYITPTDVADTISCVARAFDEPFGNSSAVPALLCARLAREHGSQVLLTGDGGDELFAGNTRYVKQNLFEAYYLAPHWLRKQVLEALLLRWDVTRRLPLIRKVRSYIEQARQPMPQRTKSYNALQRMSLDSMFEPDFLRAIDVQQPLAMLKSVYDRAPARSMLNRMLFLDWKFTLADNDLRKVMRTCETAGVEARFPMLDAALVDLSLTVPPALKIKRLGLRYFYKQALDDFLPQAIIRKSKHGFGLPFGEWLKSSPELQHVIYTSLQSLKTRGFVRPAFIDNLITTHRDGHAAYYGEEIWVLALLEMWFNEHRLAH